MSSSTREEIVDSVDALDADLDRLCSLSFDVLATPERLRVLERLEATARRLRVPTHPLINQLAEQAGEEELGGRLADALANRLRISRSDANRRIAEAADLGERRVLTGETLAPELTATAGAQREGRVGDGHVTVIRSFFRRLPDGVDLLTRQAAEADLANKAEEYRPDELAKYAAVLMDCLNPDGNFTDDDRARRRGIVIGRQGLDGMSRLSGYLNPELRATFDAVLAKLAAPGMCNPDDEASVVDGEPSDDASRRDTRSGAQRNHDGLLAGLRGLLMSGKLGQHNGLPTTVIVTTTLKDLAAGAGRGVTAGGSLLPMSDLVRMAAHAHHYWPSSRTANLWPFIIPNGWPPQLSESCCTPGIVDAQGLSVPHPDTGLKRTTPKGGRRRTAPTPTRWRWPAGPTTGWSKKGGLPARTPEAIPSGYRRRIWIYGQPRVNTFHHPEKLLAPDEEPGAA